MGELGVGPDEVARRRWTGWLALLLATQGVLQLVLTRGLTFRLDEWWLITHRLSAPDRPSLLVPHNSHPTMLPLVVYRALLDGVGMDSYVPYVVVLVALQAAMGWLLFVLLRPRVGPALALAGVGLQACCGLAAESQLWPGIMTQTASLVALEVSLVLLDRTRSTRTDVGVSAALMLGLACSGFGVIGLVVVGTELLARREIRRLVIVLGPPSIAFGLWLVLYGDSRAHTDGVATSARWAIEAALALSAAVVGGRRNLVGAAVLLGLLVLFLRSARRLPAERWPRTAALLVGGAAFYGMTAVGRATISGPGSGRYLTAGLLLLLLVAGELADAVTLPSWAPAAAWGLVLVGLVNGNVAAWRDTRADYLHGSDQARAALTAFDLVGPSHAPADTEMAPEVMPAILSGEWATARARFDGDPAWPVAALPARSADERALADRVLVRLGGVALVDAPSAISTCEAIDGRLVLSASGLVIQAGDDDASVSVRRFGPEDQVVELGTVPAGRTGAVMTVADGAEAPYVIVVDGGARGCPLTAPTGG